MIAPLAPSCVGTSPKVLRVIQKMAILFMNVMAPLIDHYVIEGNIKRREKRLTLAAA